MGEGAVRRLGAELRGAELRAHRIARSNCELRAPHLAAELVELGVVAEERLPVGVDAAHPAAADDERVRERDVDADHRALLLVLEPVHPVAHPAAAVEDAHPFAQPELRPRVLELVELRPPRLLRVVAVVEVEAEVDPAAVRVGAHEAHAVVRDRGRVLALVDREAEEALEQVEREDDRRVQHEHRPVRARRRHRERRPQRDVHLHVPQLERLQPDPRRVDAEREVLEVVRVEVALGGLHRCAVAGRLG